MIIRLILVVIYLFSLSAFAADRAVVSPQSISDISGAELYSVSAAFIAGVSNYDKDWPDLPGVKDDVDSVVSELSSRGFTVEVAENQTKNQFESKLESFLKRYADDSKARILIYFAGHGHTLNSASGKEGYIVLKDAADPQKGLTQFKAGSIPMSYFSELAKNIKAEHALFLFDSCFSGTVFSAMRSIPEFVKDSLHKPVRQFITSGTENQLVPDDSVFRRRFISGLEGGADANNDELVTGSELGEYLKRAVSGYSAGLQTPVYGKMQGYEGEFLFFNNKFAVREKPTPPSTEKDELLAVIKKNPHSPNASKAMARLREIDKTLSNLLPVMPPERKDLVIKAKSQKFIRNSIENYSIIIAPLTVSTMGGDFKVAFRVTAKDENAYRKLKERREMLLSVMSRRLNESNLQLVDNIAETRERMRDAANSGVDLVCPGCTAVKPSIAGLMGL